MSQLALPLDWTAGRDQADFLISDANAEAARQIEHWSTWPLPVTILSGPRKSGRSTLGRLFVARTGGQLIDDAEAKPEEAIFHAWNTAVSTRRPLLLVADAPPPAWTIALPDLRSRLAACPKVAIHEPDDALIAALIERALVRRGLTPPGALIEWIVRRVERSYVAVARAIEALDGEALLRRGRLGLGAGRDALVRAGVIDGSQLAR